MILSKPLKLVVVVAMGMFQDLELEEAKVLEEQEEELKAKVVEEETAHNEAQISHERSGRVSQTRNSW